MAQLKANREADFKYLDDQNCSAPLTTYENLPMQGVSGSEPPWASNLFSPRAQPSRRGNQHRMRMTV